MPTNDLNILVISFYFPPYNKVGGRRWAKHCKYLVRSKIPTFVLTGNFPGSSPWDKDVESFKNNIFRIEHVVNEKPFFQTKLPVNFFEKIKWKFSYYIWEATKNKISGNYNDPSLNNEPNYLNKAAEIIKTQNINTVILSVGPFKYSSILIELKKQFPTLKFIIDYRDYWEDSFAGLSEKQITTELELQKNVAETVDLIMSPNNEMKKYYETKFRKESYCLPHCYDQMDIDTIKVLEKKTNDLNLIYGGAFYSNIDENISLIKEFVNTLSQSKSVKADFYVSIKGYEKELAHPLIERFDFLDSEKYFEKVKNADLAILILPPNRVNAMSSKFFELVALRKPILYFGGNGEVSDFLIKNELGFHVTPQNIEEQVKSVLDNLITSKIPNCKFNYSEYSFEHQTNLLINELLKL